MTSNIIFREDLFQRKILSWIVYIQKRKQITMFMLHVSIMFSSNRYRYTAMIHSKSLELENIFVQSV